MEKMSQQKKEIYYFVMILDIYARKYNLSLKDAFYKLKDGKALDFLLKAYPAEHLLSLDEVLEDITEICKNNS